MTSVQDLSQRDDDILLAIMRRILREDDNCVDVGCNQGQILAPIIQLAPRGRHFAFEALPDLAAALVSRFPHVTVSAVAISDQNGLTSYRHVVNDAGYSGIRERRYDRPDPVVETITVPMKRLDDCLPVDLPIRFIKIDVEGAELQVLRGAVTAIRSKRPFIYFEHGRGASEYYGTTPEDIFDLLVLDLGYSIFIPSPWLDGFPSLSRSGLRQEYDHGQGWNYLAVPHANKYVANLPPAGRSS